MICCCCGFDLPHGVYVESGGKKVFACEVCFNNPSMWFGFAKWQLYGAMQKTGMSKKHIDRALKSLEDRSQKRLC